MKTLRVCETCPFLVKNHGKKHEAGWYTRTNIRRLWSGLRSGKAPGILCHSSDPQNEDYGGGGKVKPGHEHECAGALLLLAQNINALSAGSPEPFQPGLKRPAIAWFLERHLFSQGKWPDVEDRSGEVGLPWRSVKP